VRARSVERVHPVLESNEDDLVLLVDRDAVGRGNGIGMLLVPAPHRATEAPIEGSGLHGRQAERRQGARDRDRRVLEEVPSIDEWTGLTSLSPAADGHVTWQRSAPCRPAARRTRARGSPPPCPGADA